MRSAQTSFGSPIDTQTSVCTKSTPRRASARSSVSVSRAPVSAACLLASATTRPRATAAAGATMRTSMPRMAPMTSSELPMLLRASPT